jgi:hypothetical protein
MDEDNFLSRWSRRKTQERQGGVPREPAPPPVLPGAEPRPGLPAPEAGAAQHDASPVLPQAGAGPAAGAAGDVPAEAAPREPAPTLEDAARLTRDSDYSRFVAKGVDDVVKRAAMKKLFADPHFNVMDGLDIYIDDYSKADPIPPAMLRQLTQGRFGGLFDEKPEAAAPVPAGPTAPVLSLTDNPRRDLAAAADPATGQAPAGAPVAPAPTETAHHEDPDLRLQPDHAAGAPGPGDGAGGDTGRLG